MIESKSEPLPAMQSSEDATIYRKDYHKHPLERPHVHQHEQYKKPTGEMDTNTSYKQEYTEKHGIPAKPVKNEGQRKIPAEFQGEPTYKSDYKRWEGAGRPQAYGMQAAWQPPQAPFQGQTTSKQDFQSKEIQPRPSFKPQEGAKMSDAPFESNTCHRNDYVKLAMPAKHVHLKEEYKPSGAKFDSLTTSKRDYKGQPGQPMASFKPEGRALQSDAPFEDGTTQRADYQAHPLERPYVHQHEQYKKPTGEMDTNTSYKQEYTEKHGMPAKAIRNEGQRQVPAEFQGEPTYKSDYKRWEGAGRPQAYGMQAAWQPPEAPFQGQTTSKQDFQSKEIQPRPSFKPQEGAKVSDAPFESNTSHRNDYVKHAMPAKHVHLKEEYKPSEAKFDSLTTSKRDYKGQPGQPMASFKPEGRALQSEAPFEDGTTQRTDFQAHPIERPYVHQHEQYKKPVGEMDTNTSYKQEYTEKHGMPAKPIKNEGQRQVPAEFQGEPTYKSDYKRWDGAGRPQAYGMQAAWQPPQAPFQGQTTSKQDFQSKEIQPRPSFKPQEGAKVSDAPFESNTSHRNDYVKHAMPAKHVHLKEEYKPSEAKFDSLTTSKRDYKGQPGQPMASFKPEGRALQSDAPFEDGTTQRTDFQAHQIERPYVHQHEQYKKPTGEMDTNTSYKQEYTEKHGMPAKPIRNEGQRQVPAEFQGEPTYKSDYKRWEGAGRPQAYGMQAAWQPPQAPFQGQTTSKQDFQSKEIQPRPSFKPQEGAKVSDAPFESNTSHRNDYVEHAMPAKHVHLKEEYKPSGAKFDSLTTSKRDYKGQPGQPMASFKPEGRALQSDAPFEDGTTQRTDFQPHPLERPYVHQHEQYKKPTGEMDTNTSYKQEYTEKHGMPAKAIRNEGQRMVPAEFQGEPTYKSDYKRWEGAGRPQAYGMQAAWQPPQAPFQGQTTFQHDFQGKEIQPRYSFKPQEGAKMSDTPFDGSTCHRNDYVPHAMPARYVHPREQYKPSGAQFDGLSTSKRDYKGHLGQPTVSFKPEARALQSEAPFEDGTTQRHDYKKWPMSRPFVHVPEQYRKPEGNMEMNTTHNTTYKQMPIERVVARRPASVKKNNAPFDGQTNYSQDYRKWEGQRAQMPKAAEYMPNTAPFEGASTYKNHYVPHASDRTRAIRPDQGAFRSDAAFDDHTMYRQDFTPKPIQVCEAKTIDQPGSRFRFVELDHNTHRQYVPIRTMVTPLHNNGPSAAQQRLAMSVA